ncbi:hypothetical protein ACFXKG_18610 [Streptomyces sp. NPDC059255]|uniref:hypothetical protein n=1 Tax=Streptomyces sp. NPDC059255 TaxID=3346793 RepID=UPI0036BB91F0
MSFSPRAHGPALRPAAVVNADIRALWAAAGGALTREERARYEQLLAEWEAAARAEVERAA